MENHKFEQSTFSSLCKHCYRPKLDDYHIPFLDSSDMKESDENIHTKNGDNLLSPTQETITLVGELTEETKTEQTNQPDCYGHKCPSCGDFWLHTYKCWPDAKVKESMHCAKCFGVAVVEINRPSHLEIITSEQTQVTESGVLKQIEIEHESFVVLEALKDPNIDFRQWCASHLRDIRSKMEKLATQDKATKKALLKLEKEEQSKLTPEEIEDYKRRVGRQKKIDREGVLENARDEWKKKLVGLTKLMGSEQLAIEQLSNIYKLQGKEVPK